MASFRARLARRTLPTVAAVAGAGLITAGMTAPSFAADPLVDDLRGVVTNAAGAPLAGIDVAAFNPATNSYAGGATTDAAGAFAFTDLESGSYRVQVFDYQLPAGANYYTGIPFVGEWNGDAGSYKAAPAVVVTADAPGAPVSFALEQYGLITGTNTGNGAALYSSFASAHGVEGLGNGATSPTQKIDPATGECVDGDPVEPDVQCIDQGGQAYRLFVRAGTYKVLLGGYNYTPAVAGPPFIDDKYSFFVSKYFGGGYSLADATRVTVAAGQTVGGVSAALTENLENVVKARIDGQTAPGKTLKANVGRWAAQTETKFTYSWTINGAVVSTTSSYVVKKADLRKKVVLTITAANDDNVGVAQITSARVGLKNKLSAKSQATGNGKVKFSVQLKGKKLNGKFKGKAQVWYLSLDGKDPFSYHEHGARTATPKLVGKGKVSANGTATITTKKVPEGKGLFMVTYKGSKKAAANQTPWKAVKVK